MDEPEEYNAALSPILYFAAINVAQDAHQRSSFEEEPTEAASPLGF